MVGRQPQIGAEDGGLGFAAPVLDQRQHRFHTGRRTAGHGAGERIEEVRFCRVDHGRRQRPDIQVARELTEDPCKIGRRIA